MKNGLNAFWANLTSVVFYLAMLAAASYTFAAHNYPLTAVLVGYALIKLINVVQGSVSDSIKRKALLVAMRKYVGDKLTQSDWDLLNELIINNHH